MFYNTHRLQYHVVFEKGLLLNIIQFRCEKNEFWHLSFNSIYLFTNVNTFLCYENIISENMSVTFFKHDNRLFAIRENVVLRVKKNYLLCVETFHFINYEEKASELIEDIEGVFIR